MKTSTTRIVAFFAAAIAGIAMGATSEASAWFARNHATKCMTQGGTPLDLNFAVQNDSTASSMLVLCPAEDTETHPKQNTVSMNVHGYDDSTAANVTTLACRSTWDVVGGACQTGPSSAGLGNFNMSVPTGAVWTAARASDFGYVYVSLPAKQGTAYRSMFRGTYQAN